MSGNCGQSYKTDNPNENFKILIKMFPSSAKNCRRIFMSGQKYIKRIKENHKICYNRILLVTSNVDFKYSNMVKNISKNFQVQLHTYFTTSYFI